MVLILQALGAMLDFHRKTLPGKSKSSERLESEL